MRVITIECVEPVGGSARAEIEGRTIVSQCVGIPMDDLDKHGFTFVIRGNQVTVCSESRMLALGVFRRRSSVIGTLSRLRKARQIKGFLIHSQYSK